MTNYKKLIKPDHKEDVLEFLHDCKGICVRNQMYEWAALCRKTENDLRTGHISINESFSKISDILENATDNDLLKLINKLKKNHRQKFIGGLLK